MKKKVSSEKSILTVLNAMPDPAFLVDGGGVVLDVNGSFEKTLGLKRKEVVGMNCLDAGFLPEEAIKFLRKRFNKLKKGVALKASSTREVYLHKQDGNGIYVEMTARPLEYRGEIADVVVLHDVTERKRLEEILRCSEETVSSVNEETSDIIFMVNSSGDIEYCSPSTEILLGYDAEELKEKRVADLVHPEDAAAFEKISVKTRMLDYSTSVEVRLQKADGSWRCLELAGKNVLDDPSIEGLVLRFRDITEQKQTEFELQASENRFKAVFENASDGIIYFSPDGEILHANVKMEEIFGFCREELIGTNFADLPVADPEEMARIIELFYGALKGRYRQYMELELYRKDGSTVNVSVSAGIVSSGEQTEALFVIVRDIQKQKEAEARIEHLNNVLLAIRDVNQLIFRERDRHRMIEKACQTMIVTRGYASAWICVLDEEREVVTAAEAGVGDGFVSLSTQMKAGQWPPCATQAFEQKEPIIVAPGSSECTRCPLHYLAAGGGAIAACLESNERFFGVMCVSGPGVSLVSDDEKSLFEEVAEDIAFALYTIELDKARLEAEDELQEREHQYSSLVELSPDGILVLKGPEIVFMNEKASEIVGYPRSECVGSSILDLIKLYPPDNLSESELEDLLSDIKEVLSENVGPRTFSMPVKSGSGEQIWLEVNSSPIEYRGEPARLEFIRDITERVRNEEAVRESEEKLRVLFDNIDDGIVITDLNGRIVDANKVGMLRHGYISKEELIGAQGLEFIAESDRDRAMKDMERAVSDNDPKGLVEYSLLTGDGNQIEVEATASLLYDDNGNPYAFVNVIRDVTERKKMERELRKSEEKYRELVENIAEVVYVLGVDGMISYVSPSVKALLGYSPEEIMEKRFSAFVHDGDLPSTEENLRRLFSGEVMSGEYRLIAGSGKHIWVRTSSQPVFDGDRVIGVRGVLIDITERKQMEEALRESEERIRAMVENSFEGVAIIGPDGSVIYESPANDRLLGYQPGAGAEKDIFGMVHPEDRQGLIEDFTRLTQSPGEVFSSIYRSQHVDGSWHILAATAKNCIDDPLIGGVVVNFRDITEQKEAEKALLEREEKFREIFDNANDELLYLDVYGNVLDVNRRIEDIFGYEPEEVIGKNFAEVGFVTDEEMARFTEEMFKATESGETRRLFDVGARHKDGHMVRVEVSPSLIKRDGEIEGLLIIVRDVTERKEAEEMFARLAASSQVGTYVIQDGRFVFVSPAFQKDLSMSEEELLVTDPLSVVHPDDRDRVREEAVRMLEGQSDSGYEFRVIAKNGNMRWAFEKVASIEYGGRRAVLGSYMDITELKEAEAAIKQADEKYRKLVEQVSDIIFSVDRDGVFTYMSPAGESITGYTDLEIIGRPFTDFIYEEDVPRVMRQFELKAFAGEMQEENEVRVVMKGGRIRWIRARVRPVLEAGQIVGFSGVMSDVTERKEAEHAILESELKFREIFENAKDEILYLDEDGTIIDRNIKGEDMLGYTREEVIGRNFYELSPVIPQDRMMDFQKLFRDALEGEGGPGLAELEMIHKNGNPVHIEANISLIERNGNKARMLVVFRDVTERKQMQEQLGHYWSELERNFEELQIAYEKLKEMDKMKDQFLSTVSHELRTPLTSIKSFAEILLTYEGDREVQKEFLNIINEESERLNRLINDFLDLSKIESGRIEWYSTIVEIPEVIERAIGANEVFLNEMNMKLEVDVGPELPPVWCDLDRLIQVVSNLISNATKFTSSGGTISIRAKPEVSETPGITGGMVKVSVTDNGVGIASENQEAIFDKFTQIGDTLTDKPQGSGLGLSICKEIVEYYKGEIWVESEPGNGSTFSFTLPVVQKKSGETDEAELSKAEADRGNVGSKPGNTILVVDDEPYMRRFLGHELTGRGYRVIEASGGREAIEMVRRYLPDLITLDIMMPDINGFDVTTILKSNPATRHIPIMVISILDDKAEALQRGADEYVPKPSSGEVILEKVTALLRKPSKMILVVDDDEILVRSITYELKIRGFTTSVAHDGEKAIEMVRSNPPDLIILDILMPGIDGHQVIKQLKSSEETIGIPVIVLTGAEISGGRVKAFELGASAYFTKSGGLEKLFETAATILSGQSVT